MRHGKEYSTQYEQRTKGSPRERRLVGPAFLQLKSLAKPMHQGDRRQAPQTVDDIHAGGVLPDAKRGGDENGLGGG